MSAVAPIATLPARFRVEVYDAAGNERRSLREPTREKCLARAREILNGSSTVFELIAHDSQPAPGQWWIRVRYRRSSHRPGDVDVLELPPTQEF